MFAAGFFQISPHDEHLNEKLNNMEEYREELQEAEYSGGMRR